MATTVVQSPLPTEEELALIEELGWKAHSDLDMVGIAVRRLSDIVSDRDPGRHGPLFEFEDVGRLVVFAKGMRQLGEAIIENAAEIGAGIVEAYQVAYEQLPAPAIHVHETEYMSRMIVGWRAEKDEAARANLEAETDG